MQPQNDDESSLKRPLTPPNQSSLPNQPPSEAPQPPSTHRKSGTPRLTSNVTEHRSEVLNQMKGEMVRCDKWPEGFDVYLPASGIGDADIDAAIEVLKDELCLQAIDDGDQNLQFTAFETNPSGLGTNERKTYEHLIKICEVLGGLQVENKRKASCELIQKPNNFSSAETPGGNFIPDAYLRLKKSTMPPLNPPSTQDHIADMAVPSEYKLHERNFLDNRKKLLGATTYCMNDDPRRMHIYGITIEDSMMTVWYFSRSHSAMSPAFDFTKDPRRYIQVMLSLLFATKEELGYDETIRRHVDSDAAGEPTLGYVYKVKDKDKRERYFKTQGAIFEHRSLCTSGRATRVWKVLEVGSFDHLESLGRSPMVLKDVWLDSHSKTECQNLDAIFQELENLAKLLEAGNEPLDTFNGFDDESRDALKECLKRRSWDRYFLSKVCDWQGYKSKEMPPAAKPDSTLFDPLKSTPTPSSNPHSDRSRSTTTRVTDLVPDAQNQPLRHYCPKQQYRVVFNEVCEALHDVRRLQDVVTALRDSVFALQLMFLAGWVHRDISSGNIYAYRPQGNGTDKTLVRGILADLEYAKRFDHVGAKGSSDPKTGTAYFMAIEIQKQVLFCEIAMMAEPSPNEDALQTFKGAIHNYEHDMESIFWLFLWILLVRFPSKRSVERKEEFRRVLSAIFQDTSQCPSEREQLFVRQGALRALLDLWINPELAPISAALVVLRGKLANGYVARMFRFNDRASYAVLYQYLMKALEFDQIAAVVEESEPLRASSTGERPAQVMIKRKHSSIHVDEGDNNEPSSKVTRVAGSTDAAWLRTLHDENPEAQENESSQLGGTN